MAYVDHDNLWNMSNMVDEYNIQAPTLLWSESCLTEKSKSFLKENVHNILCVGCGGGREVLPLHQTFENATIYANDIAEKMIEKAIANFKLWNIERSLKPLLGSIENIVFKEPVFQVITAFNNVLCFVTPRRNRNQVFKKFYDITTPNGVLIGMVHHVYGTPLKTLYFLLQRVISPFQKKEFGDRNAGKKEQKYFAHYYSRTELRELLEQAGYTQIEITSLAEFYKSKERKYNRLKGYNNLMFYAVKV